MEIVSIRDVKYTYPGSGGFSLEIPELGFCSGECAAVCGHNGSGKTTLGKLIVGLLRPLSGKVLIKGEDIADWPLGKIGARVGYIYQEPSRQVFAPTVLEDITFPLTLKGKNEAEANELARSMLSRFDMETLENAATYTLSRGEKQRLAIVATLVNNPGFLVLDEPTTGLDSRRKQILGDMLKQLVRQNVGILLISHDAEFAGEHASRTYRMAGGRML